MVGRCDVDVTGKHGAGSRCRMSASMMEALELFHNRSVAVSHTTANSTDGQSPLLRATCSKLVRDLYSAKVSEDNQGALRGLLGGRIG